MKIIVGTNTDIILKMTLVYVIYKGKFPKFDSLPTKKTSKINHKKTQIILIHLFKILWNY